MSGGTLLKLDPPSRPGMLARFKAGIWDILQKLQGIPVRHNQRLHWKSSPPVLGAPRVFYGYDVLPGSAEKATGGIVKSQLLQTVFPNIPVGANILYLISSALPPHAAILVQEARRADVRVVLNQNGVGYPAWLPRGWEKLNRGMADVLTNADHVLYQSHFAKLGADRFLAPAKQGFDILHNAVDTRRFRSLAARPGLDGPVLLLAGSHGVFYRVQAALRVLALGRRRMPDARLILAGAMRWDTDTTRMQAMISRECLSLGLDEKSVEIRGPYSQDEAPFLYQQADVLVHTQSNDVCPTVVLEAMACGLPVVYSDSGGTGELVGKEAGIGVPDASNWEVIVPPDPQLMADAVAKVMEDRATFSDAARQRVVHGFSMDAWLKRHEDLFLELMQRG